MASKKKKAADPHANCPAPLWMGTEWQCTNHSPPQVVQLTREPYQAPHDSRGRPAKPTALAPAPRAEPPTDSALVKRVEVLEAQVAELQAAAAAAKPKKAG